MVSTLLGVVVVAAFVRWLGYTGFFGSDEVTYIASAFRVLDGDWTVDDYVGANRLGVNLPMAAFAALLGRNELGAAASSLLCSLGEVLLVTWVAWRMAGQRAALCAGLLMATLPTHVHFAGRIMADAPLALTITAAFVLFYEAEARRWSTGFFLAGVCAGLSFWIKPVTLFVFSVLLAYPLLVRRFDPRWLWMVAGLLFAMAINGLLYLALTGRFWFVFENMQERRQSGYLEAGAAAGEIHSDAADYLVFLFGKIYHTGLLGYLAVAGALVLMRRRWSDHTKGAGQGALLACWGLGMLLLLSLLPVSLRPLILIPKQTNYMLMFLAPLCVLGGMALAQLKPVGAAVLLAVACGVGVVFALALQASVAVFTANSMATLQFARDHKETPLHVMSNAWRAALFEGLVSGGAATPVLSIEQALSEPARAAERLVVIDPETFAWDLSRPFPDAASVPACWQPVQTFQGQPTAVGVRFFQLLLAAAAALPPSPRAALLGPLQRLTQPRPAQLYRLPPGC
ncbi:MAG: phospholipid carrier-dependent glycosyltransferase [Rubrivivax sp.]|nr:phospholipid carrier-dependent glycosyltransferase [Rubrivivax sp.]